MPPDVSCHYCGTEAGTTCARCDAALCLRHAHDRLHRCRECEREFRSRPSRRIVTAAVGSVIIGTSTVIGGFVGLILAYALALWAGAAGPAVFIVFLLFTALGIATGSVAAMHCADDSIRPQFLLEHERRPPQLPVARVVV
jgi:uncharacterized protein (DUF983 family)